MDFPILTTMMLVPLAGAIACLFAGQASRMIALGATLVTFASRRDAVGQLRDWRRPMAVSPRSYELVAGFSYALGIDGIRADADHAQRVPDADLHPCQLGSDYQACGRIHGAFLFMEVLMIGTFAAQDIFLFYIMFEAGLIPMYLIIGVWGGDNRIYASYKFFLYTLLGSVLMLVAMFWMVAEAGTSDIPTLMQYPISRKGRRPGSGWPSLRALR